MSIAETPLSTSWSEHDDSPQRLILRDVDWETYDALCRAFESRGNLFLTYEQGTLEIMSPSPRHERAAQALGRLVEVLAEEMGIDIEPGGSITFRRETLDRGMEPDRCFWIAREPEVRGKVDFDANDVAPPDLFIEIEATRTLTRRLSICAALGIPEVWRFNGKQIWVLQLGTDGEYREVTQSLSFPGIDVGGIVPFLGEREGVTYFEWIEGFRRWVRSQLSPT